jgi:hypothetical protein
MYQTDAGANTKVISSVESGRGPFDNVRQEARLLPY